MAAAVGAAAGVALAVPLGVLLGVFLFKRISGPLVEHMMSEAKGWSIVETIVFGILLFVAALAIVVVIVISLVAPIFLLVPLLVTAVALRLTRAGLIMRSLWLMLAALAVLSAVFLPVLHVFDDRTNWWTWVVLVAAAAFLGRLLVEAYKPDLAGRPASGLDVWLRWKRLGVAWLVLIVVVVVGMISLASNRITR
jgi:hypothetical protein